MMGFLDIPYPCRVGVEGATFTAPGCQGCSQMGPGGYMTVAFRGGKWAEAPLVAGAKVDWSPLGASGEVVPPPPEIGAPAVSGAGTAAC
jgi:hypothetical protein